MRHAGFAQTTYLTLTNRQTDSYLSGLSLLLYFGYILKKENIFLFTAKVHVRLSKFGDRLLEKEKSKRKRDKPALCNRCVL